MILDYSYDRLKATVLTKNLTENNLPIDPIALINTKYNVEVFYEDLCGEEGYTFFDQSRNKYRIYIDEHYRVSRRNFTIAHEVGHIALGHFAHSELSDHDIHMMLDKHANAFASTLLMPAHILQKFNFFSAEYIANAFNVSIEALNIRANYVDISVV